MPAILGPTHPDEEAVRNRVNWRYAFCVIGESSALV